MQTIHQSRHYVLLASLCASLYATATFSQPDLAAQEAQLSLKQLAAPHFALGVGVDADIDDRSDDAELLAQHFDFLTPENCMKVQAVQTIEGEFQFERSDKIMAFARARNLRVVGHCLVWAKDDRTPEWFFKDGEEDASEELLMTRMRTHIETVMTRYRGQIEMWDVVNEALADGSDGYLRDSGWSRANGEEFIVKAFEFAREFDPDAFLIYNDYRCDTPDKRNKLIRLARMFRSRDAPVDAIGLQGHYELDSVPYDGLEEMFKAMRELGFKVVVSELDIDVVKRGRWWADDGIHRDELRNFDPYREGCPPEILERQAEQYAKLFELFVKYDDVIERVSFWNLHDGQSWLNSFPWRRTNHPLLFDRDRKPKPAFAAVAEVLQDSDDQE